MVEKISLYPFRYFDKYRIWINIMVIMKSYSYLWGKVGGGMAVLVQFISSPKLKSHRWAYSIGRHPSAFSNGISSDAVKLILTKFHIHHLEAVEMNRIVFLSQSDKNSGCYGNLYLPLTYNGENENWHLLPSQCRYFDRTFTEMFLEWSSFSLEVFW